MIHIVAGGGLDSYLHKNEGNVSVMEKLNFLYHAADGLSFMHHNGCMLQFCGLCVGISP